MSVVGSTNTDRDLEFRANESDVDIISNPSQSSIEVLDPNVVQSSSRKTSEERRISQIPDLQTIDDDFSQTQSFIDREFQQLLAEQQEITLTATVATVAEPKPKALAQVQLTESSSSGSVTDSICTTYEQQAGKQTQEEKPREATTKNAEDIVLHNMLMAQSNNNNNNQIEVTSSNSNGHLKQAEDAGISNLFGGKWGCEGDIHLSIVLSNERENDLVNLYYVDLYTLQN